MSPFDHLHRQRTIWPTSSLNRCFKRFMIPCNEREMSWATWAMPRRDFRKVSKSIGLCKPLRLDPVHFLIVFLKCLGRTKSTRPTACAFYPKSTLQVSGSTCASTFILAALSQPTAAAQISCWWSWFGPDRCPRLSRLSALLRRASFA